MVPLEVNPLFSSLSATDIEALRRFAQEQSVRAGTVMFRQGDAGDGLYIVKSGMVSIVVSSGSQSPQSIYRVRAGDFFGEMAVLEDQPRSAGAIAVDDTVVYFLPRQDLLEWLDKTPAAARLLLREVSHRLRTFNRQYIRDVIQAERLAVIGRFARSVVHDLKNPLNVIGLTAEVACLDRSTQADRVECYARIRKQIERINSLIGEILEFTQSTSGTAVLSCSKFDAFVERVLQELQEETSQRGVTLVVENTAPAVDVLLDMRRFRRVFHNLVHNAVDFLHNGGTITVRFREEPKDVITEIEDTGPGIAPEIREHLFEPFTTHGKVHGTGLGLSICHRIVTDHGGWIRAVHEPGRGAIFAFSIPKARA